MLVSGYAYAAGGRQDDTLQNIMSRLDRLEQNGGMGGFTSYDGTSNSDGEQSHRANVHAFDAMHFDFGGYLHTGMTYIRSDLGDFEHLSFNIQEVDLIMKAMLREDLMFFAALSFSYNSALDMEDPDSPFFREFCWNSCVDVAWANYTYADWLQVQWGRFATPMGIINIEHFQPMLMEALKPMFLRPHGGETIFPTHLTGLNVHGKVYMGDNDSMMIEYNAFTGTYDAGPINILAGARVAWSMMEIGLTVGGNFFHGKRAGGTFCGEETYNYTWQDIFSDEINDYNLVGIDVLWDWDHFIWKNEFFYSWEDDMANDIFAFYTQPAYRLNDNWLFFYRYDVLRTNPVNSNWRGSEHILGVNWLPYPNVRVRGEWVFSSTKNTSAIHQDNDIGVITGVFSF